MTIKTTTILLKNGQLETQVRKIGNLVARKTLETSNLARLPRGEERPGGGRPEALLLLWLEPTPSAESEGEEARRGARGVDIDGRFEVKSC